MQDNSDQFATPEEESAHYEEVVGTDDPAEEEPEETSAESEETEEPEESTEEVKPKKPGFVEIKDPAIKARVDEITRKSHEKDRKIQAIEAEKQRMARELEDLKRPPAPKEVPVPSADPVTDPELFARQQAERDKYIREHTKYEAETESRNKAREQSEVARKAAMVDGYIENIGRLKLNPDVIAKAADVWTAYGIAGDHPLIDDLLEDKDGPAIVKYGADHPEVLSEIANMKPSKALAYIEREIRAKLNIKPVSKAPPPPTKVGGTRQSGGKSAGGWTFS